MKKLSFLIGLVMLSVQGFGQKLPNDIQHIIDSIKNESKIALANYRINPQKGHLRTNDLSQHFLQSKELWGKVERLNLNIGMIYDDQMRERIVQLIKNEYEKNELDTLVNKQLNWMYTMNRIKAMNICKFDTLPVYKNTYDSLYKVWNSEQRPNYNGEYKAEVYKILQIDTTKKYKITFDSILVKEREKEKKGFISNNYYDYTCLVELCSYINDKRFIKPLEEALKKPNAYQKQYVIESLVRMRVEPYLTSYLKSRTRTIKQIKKGEIDFKIEDLVYIIRNQISFKELSKYLLSDAPYTFETNSKDDGYIVSSTMFQKAVNLIKDNLENEDLQRMLKGKDGWNSASIRIEIYNWMQRNNGKYKISRLW